MSKVRCRSPIQRLFDPIAAESLALFRIAFGAILLWQIVRYFSHGWIEQYYLAPRFHFTYFGFGWVRPWPGAGLYVHFAVLAAAAAMITLGFFYRAACATFFLGFSYVFLLEKARYLNHFYLVILLTLLMVFVPAHRAWSMDAARKGWQPFVPAWSLWLLRAQIGLVYFFAAVAKMNADWLSARPLDVWLAERASLPLIGPLLSQPWAPWLFSYGGLLLDLLAAPLLLWRRSRLPCFVAVVVFHLLNAQLFGIGIFPWTMIAATSLFFDADWPRQWQRKWVKTHVDAGATTPANTPRVDTGTDRGASEAQSRISPSRATTLRLLAAYLLVQILVPLRHFLYPGDVSWTEEGHAFSWHMKLRSKDSRLSFVVYNPDHDKRILIDPRTELESWQVEKCGGRPDMILEYAHHLAKGFRSAGRPHIEVRAAAAVSLNSHPSCWLVDPSIDLAKEQRGLHRYRWILGEGTRAVPPHPDPLSSHPDRDLEQ